MGGAAGAVVGGALALEALADEPSMSQFSQAPGATPTLTQRARRFRDIVPEYSFARFLSHVPARLLVQMLSDALHNAGVAAAPPQLFLDPHDDAGNGWVAAGAGGGGPQLAAIRVRTVDSRRQGLHGEISVDRYYLPDGAELLEVRFVKVKGDPLEWRRFFKRVVLTCQDAVYRP